MTGQTQEPKTKDPSKLISQNKRTSNIKANMKKNMALRKQYQKSVKTTDNK